MTMTQFEIDEYFFIRLCPLDNWGRFNVLYLLHFDPPKNSFVGEEPFVDDF